MLVCRVEIILRANARVRETAGKHACSTPIAAAGSVLDLYLVGNARQWSPEMMREYQLPIMTAGAHLKGDIAFETDSVAAKIV
jgi:hypothetical protein